MNRQELIEHLRHEYYSILEANNADFDLDMSQFLESRGIYDYYLNVDINNIIDHLNPDNDEDFDDVDAPREFASSLADCDDDGGDENCLFYYKTADERDAAAGKFTELGIAMETGCDCDDDA